MSMTEENFSPPPLPTSRELELVQALREIREILGACKITLPNKEVVYAPFYVRWAVRIINDKIGEDPVSTT
jgi:hypothetical protein